MRRKVVIDTDFGTDADGKVVATERGPRPDFRNAGNCQPRHR